MKNYYSGCVFKRSMQGFALLEALIAILIFSIAIIGVTVFQGSALRESGQARYRAEAMVIANQIIGDLWAGNTSNPLGLANTYSATSNAGGLPVNTGSTPPITQADHDTTAAWANRVSSLLPSGQAIVTATSVNTATGALVVNAYDVTVRVQWQAPGETTVHAVEYQALINGN